MTIPEGSTARVELPVSNSQKIAIVREGTPIDPGQIDGLESGRFFLRAGTYRISVSRE